MSASTRAVSVSSCIVQEQIKNVKTVYLSIIVLTDTESGAAIFSTDR